MSPTSSSSPDQVRLDAHHAEHVEVVERLRANIEALEQRPAAIRKEIAAIERDLRAKPENADELKGQLVVLRAELVHVAPDLIDVRCTLGMKMSDFALDEDAGHEDAITYLKPLLDELRSAYGRALWAADRDVAEAEERMRSLKADHHEHGNNAAALIELRFQPLVDAEMVAVNVEQANVRVARHRLALVDFEDTKQHLARELELEDALAELAQVRARVSALQEQKRAVMARFSHPHVTKGVTKGKKLVKRLGHRHA